MPAVSRDPFASGSTTPHSLESEPSRSNSTGSAGSTGSGSASAHYDSHSPTTPTPVSPVQTTSLSEPLLASTSRHTSFYVSSPLNPNTSHSRPESRGSMSRIASDESYTPLGVGMGGYPFLGKDAVSSQRGSMLLYRLASDADPWDDDVQLPRQDRFSSADIQQRYSVASDSGQSLFSAGSDSKYPTANEKLGVGKGAFLPYVYDPTSDQSSPPDADDALHDPTTLEHDQRKVAGLNFRGIVNVLVVFIIISVIVCLFTVYPILSFLRTNPRNLAIDNNVQVNGTGQVAVLPNLPVLVDKKTPDNVKTRKGWDGHDYELVFSDEFETEGRSFYPGDDPFWEAVDLWYGATEDMEWYDPGTHMGCMHLRLCSHSSRPGNYDEREPPDTH